MFAKYRDETAPQVGQVSDLPMIASRRMLRKQGRSETCPTPITFHIRSILQDSVVASFHTQSP